MKKQIIEVIFTNYNLALTAIKVLVKGSEGEYDYFLPRKDDKRSNILLVAGVSKEFLDAIRELHEEGIIESEVTSAYIAAHDSGEFYQLPIAKNVNKIYKKERWLPVLIKKGPNFPKDVKIPLIK